MVRVSHIVEPVARLRFEVSDTGPGLTADQVERLFQRFSQADGSIAREHGGTGLGLAICRKLTELMAGGIGVESTPGVGSTFWFEVAAPAAEAPAADPAPQAPTTSGGSSRVLVVDDVAMNRELVRTMLSAVGHECIEAASGAEAIELAAGQTFDVILMDMQMPVLDGVETTRRIRAAGSAGETPILALTANVLPSQLAACFDAGMQDHIAKPISPAELIEKVEAWAQRQERSPSRERERA